MSRLSRLIGRKLQAKAELAMADPVVRERVEQQERIMDLVTVAQDLAGGPTADEEARDVLARRLPNDRLLVDGAIAHTAALRTSFLNDRAFRLLSACRDRRPVRPIDPQVRDQFERERALGRLPLGPAFEHLMTLEPRLADLTAAVPAPADDLKGRVRIHQVVHDLVQKSKLVGAWTAAPDSLLRTDLAEKVVLDYLAISHNPARRDDPTPVFERQDGARINSFALFGSGDQRPRAKN